MKNIPRTTFYIFVFLFIIGCQKKEQPLTDPCKITISGEGWRIWLDSAAAWQNDPLFLPGEFDICELPVNPPTIGWESLFHNNGIECSIPATAEEYFGESNEWTYEGVMWFSREVFIPNNYANKLVFLEVASFRHRLEIYVNGKIAGYDIISLTPYKVDISKFINPGENNQIALRITNPGGQRGWEDHHIIHWNNHQIPCSYDYGGIGGEIYLMATDSIYTEDVFVKNLLPATQNRVEINITVFNATNYNQKATYNIFIKDHQKGKTVFKSKYKATLKPGQNILKQIINVEDAIKWSIEKPYLYTCQINIEADPHEHKIAQNFGFRVFELRETSTGKKYFFNNKRVRIKSAIDWGQYAYNGLYPTRDMAVKSISAIKEVGHNMLSFHRRIGDKQLMNLSDSIGVFLYEEPGGLHFESDSDTTFIVRFMREKIKRMIVRARNHPGMLIYSLSNEDYGWSPWRRDYMLMINQMDDSRFVVNSSGYDARLNFHIKPYKKEIEKDYIDEHTVGSGSQFLEDHFNSHYPHVDTVYSFYGEVACYTGPPSVVSLVEQANMNRGFDLNLYTPLYQKIQEIFYSCKMDENGSGVISNPSDITREVSRGLMYSNGRLGQIIMSHDRINGYAINGWSDGPQTVDAWSSAILDMGRNLKGPGSDMSFWNKPLQVAIFRQNGKYFSPGDTATFRVALINEGLLKAGNYNLIISIKDGEGKKAHIARHYSVDVPGGDVFASEIDPELQIRMNNDWKAGHITIQAHLTKNSDTLAYGFEQVLLQNRSSWSKDMTNIKTRVFDWDEAEKALEEAGIGTLYKERERLDCVLVGALTDTASFSLLLNMVRDYGTKLILKFDQQMADVLYDKKILSEKVSTWGGYQTHDWNGNGWGFIDNFAGKQAIPSQSIISTRSWEVPGHPHGFYPFKSFYDQQVYGLYIARSAYPEPIWGDLAGKGEFLSTTFTPDRQLLVLLASVSYGKGKIILAPSYSVDENNPFNDMLFFNQIILN